MVLIKKKRSEHCLGLNCSSGESSSLMAPRIDDNNNNKRCIFCKKLFTALALTLVSCAIILQSEIHYWVHSEIFQIQKGFFTPSFIYEHPYNQSSYYTSTTSWSTLIENRRVQLNKSKKKKVKALHEKSDEELKQAKKTRLAVVRPFCAFDAQTLPRTFDVWECFPPCQAAVDGQLKVSEECKNTKEWGDEYINQDFESIYNTQDNEVDLFLFYSQTYSNDEGEGGYHAIKAIDSIIDKFNSPNAAPWSKCFDNIYAIEANIPPELDLYIPSGQETLYQWVNGPNRQFGTLFRIFQRGEWSDYDSHFLMEGDSVPIRSYWLDALIREIEVKRPFAILGSKFAGDKWDRFYDKMPFSLLHHLGGNAVYNHSHALMDRMVGQLDSEKESPYNAIPYDYRMSQIWVEGTHGILPKLSPGLMLDNNGKRIILPDNRETFKQLADQWIGEKPFKESAVLKNYAATNIIPRYLGPEYIIHGAKLYSPWERKRGNVTLVVSEWSHDRSSFLFSHLDESDHPFSEAVVMLPSNVEARDNYDSSVTTRTQHRKAPDWMDLCEAEVNTEWFMLTNSYHKVAKHVDLMFTPQLDGFGSTRQNIPVLSFTPADYQFCFQFPYCNATIEFSRQFHPNHYMFINDFDALYHTETRNDFCEEWNNIYSEATLNLTDTNNIRPTGTAYAAYLHREDKIRMYKMSDRSLYGARDPFIKVFPMEETSDGIVPKDEIKEKTKMGIGNTTLSDCFLLENAENCEAAYRLCMWRPLFESCHAK